MKRFLCIILLGLISLSASLVFPQQPAAPAPSEDPVTFPLWENGAPGAVGHEDSDIPTLTYYRPVAGFPTAVIVAPGGGYNHFAMNHEGREVANFLNAAGLTAFVLKYRLGIRYHHPIQLQDAQHRTKNLKAMLHESHGKRL
jgi:acetyl esterase/lipase